MAVGDYVDSATANFATLAEKWNGRTWALVNTPAISAKHLYELAGVSCPSTGYCMAAGIYFGAALFWQTLTEQW
jgi:hypothetical protein